MSTLIQADNANINISLCTNFKSKCCEDNEGNNCCFPWIKHNFSDISCNCISDIEDLKIHEDEEKNDI